MILLRAFPLSVSIFWRFMLVLPLWTVFYTVMTIVSVLGALQLIGSIPVFGMVLLLFLPLVLLAINLILAMHPYLIGIQIGLRVLGIKSNGQQKNLFAAAISYGLVEAILGILFAAAFLAISLMILYNDLSLFNFRDASRISDPMANLSTQIAFNKVTIIGALSALAAMAVRAALLPVLADVVAGRGPTGQPHSFMNGFGQNFMSMMMLLLAITGISTVVIPLVGDASDFIGLTTILTTQLSGIVLFAIGESHSAVTLGHLLYGLLAVVVSVWLFSLQCAGAALSYESSATQSDRRKKVAAQARHADTPDIGELLRSRMPKHNG